MAGLLCARTDMEQKGEERDRARHEPYVVLRDPETLLQAHRDLRREMCVTRVTVIILLMLLCTTFTLLLFMQHLPACKGNGFSSKENGGAQTAAHVSGSGLEQNTEVKPWNPGSASLMVHCYILSKNESSTIPWIIRLPQPSENYSLSQDSLHLVIPQDGFYRMWLQVTYHDIGGKWSKDQLSLRSELYTISNDHGSETPRLRVFETIPAKSNKWIKSVYSGDIFSLMKGDQIKVNSSHPLLIDCDGQVGAKTFLSIHYEAPLDL
ncbi:lymphotoxin-beta [Hoplias malabaricus]|uniref:lymphotoxin-beta n=1 Tax=Hoplias malabaricus TaxID=27720 RepID=UPI00346310C7